MNSSRPPETPEVEPAPPTREEQRFARASLYWFLIAGAPGLGTSPLITRHLRECVGPEWMERLADSWLAVTIGWVIFCAVMIARSIPGITRLKFGGALMIWAVLLFLQNFVIIFFCGLLAVLIEVANVRPGG